jgi:uncharacterized caspase-like protein
MKIMFTRILLIGFQLITYNGYAAAEKRVALVVGNATYETAPLTKTLNDAKDVAASLRRLHFDVTEAPNLTIVGFDQKLDEFVATAQNADVAIFFFSGHGVQIDKRGYLAPIDIKFDKSVSSALRQLESIDDLISRIEGAAQASVIILDACRDSPLQESARRVWADNSKSFNAPKGLPRVAVTGSNTLVVYATTSGETAAEGTGRNSPFTTSLLSHMETPGLEIESMFKKVTADLMAATKGEQQPERVSRLQKEIFLKSATESVAVAPEAVQAKLQGWVAIGYVDSEWNFDVLGGSSSRSSVAPGDKLRAKTPINVRPSPADWSMRSTPFLAQGECFQVDDVPKILKAGSLMQIWAHGFRAGCV